MFVHEIIDHNAGVRTFSRAGESRAGLMHHFFSNEADARAYVARFAPSAQRGLQYLAREWGQPHLSACLITDHRAP